MSPRPRRNTDAEILAAAFRAIATLGPDRLTLGEVAREAGVTPAALVQRFGSKRALLLAAAADAAGGHVYIFSGLRQKHRSPVAAILGLAECMGVMGSTPDAVAHSLAFQQYGLRDPEFLMCAQAGSRGMRDGIQALVRDAVAAGELRRCDTRRLARVIHATLQGSMLAWVLDRHGPMDAWIRTDLRAAMGGYRVGKRGVKW